MRTPALQVTYSRYKCSFLPWASCLRLLYAICLLLHLAEVFLAGLGVSCEWVRGVCAHTFVH